MIKRFLLGLFAALMLVGMGTAAQAASPSPGAKSPAGVCVVCHGFAGGAAGPATTAAVCSPSLGCWNGIINNSAVNVGMIHNRDGSYTHGTYDALLPPHGDTKNYFGWSDGAAGFYIGNNYSALIDKWNGSAWVNLGSAFGPGQVWLLKTAQYRITAYQTI